MRSIELFTGAGGLALGAALAGFDHAFVMEQDPDSCDTLRTNKTRGVHHVNRWNILEQDVRETDYTDFAGNPDFLGGGVPCQPFSCGGKRRGHRDDRDMFPEFVRAVATLQPKAFLVENVGGLLRSSFADYCEYLILRLRITVYRSGGSACSSSAFVRTCASNGRSRCRRIRTPRWCVTSGSRASIGGGTTCGGGDGPRATSAPTS